MEKNSTYSQFLKQENELTKLKIQAEFGFQVAEESSLNPAIENIWLKQILDFERAMASSKKITIGEKLGNPVFKPLSEIPKERIPAELHAAMHILQEKNIAIDSIAGASDDVLYQFITEELLNIETDSNVPANMLTCFIYEEYHPNHEYDIQNRGQDLMNALESDDKDFSFVIHAESDNEIHVIRFEQLKRRLRLFKEAFELVQVKQYDVLSVNINEENAELSFRFNVSVLPPESKNYHCISGEGTLTLKYLFEWWVITDIDMKGIV